jgi:hypothetical protein
MRNFLDKVLEKIKTQILCRIFFFRKSWRLWDVEKYDTVRRDTDDNITQRKNFSCCLNQTTDTHLQYVIGALTDFSMVTMVTRTRLYVMFNTYIEWIARFIQFILSTQNCFEGTTMTIYACSFKNSVFFANTGIVLYIHDSFDVTLQAYQLLFKRH